MAMLLLHYNIIVCAYIKPLELTFVLTKLLLYL